MENFWKNGAVTAFIKYPGGGGRRDDFIINDVSDFEKAMKHLQDTYGKAGIIHDMPSKNTMLVFYGGFTKDESFEMVNNYKKR